MPPRGLTEDFRYVFPGVVAFPQTLFFAVVFCQLFPGQFGERERKEKKNTTPTGANGQ